MKEIWKDIKGYEGKYQISNTGLVKSLNYARSGSHGILKPRIHTVYQYVALCKDGKIKLSKIHRLVAEHFVENPQNKPYVNHKDGNKHNNMHTNLEWVTPLENNLHAYRELKKHPMKGFKYDKNKHSKEVVQIYVSEQGFEYHIATYANSEIAAKINGLCARSIRNCCNGHSGYKQVGGYIWKDKN